MATSRHGGTARVFVEYEEVTFISPSHFFRRELSIEFARAREASLW